MVLRSIPGNDVDPKITKSMGRGKGVDRTRPDDLGSVLGTGDDFQGQPRGRPRSDLAKV